MALLEHDSLRTVRALIPHFARRRAADAAFESLFWRAAAAHLPVGELGQLLLARLRLGGDGQLLDLDPQDRRLLFERLLAALGDPPDAAPPRAGGIGVGEVLALAESRLEARGEHAAAAAVYALALDEELTPGGRPAVEQTLLRFKLSHALLLLGEHDLGNLRRCADFARHALAALEAQSGPSTGSPPAVRRLSLEMNGWLGGRYEALGQWLEAARCFVAAAVAAEGAEDRVAFTARAAMALAATRETAEADRLLEAVRQDLPELGESLGRRLWEAAAAWLASQREEVSGERRRALEHLASCLRALGRQELAAELLAGAPAGGEGGAED